MHVPNFKNKSSLGEQLRLHHHHDRRRHHHHQQQQQAQPMPSMVSTIPCQRLDAKRELKKVQTDRQTDRQTDNRQQTTGKEGKRPRNPIGDMEKQKKREKEKKACDLVFFFIKLRLSTMKRAKKKKKRERERKIVYFSLPREGKGVTSIPRQEVGGIIKVIKKSEVCRALFDAEKKVFQIFRMYIICYIS